MKKALLTQALEALQCAVGLRLMTRSNQLHDAIEALAAAIASHDAVDDDDVCRCNICRRDAA